MADGRQRHHARAFRKRRRQATGQQHVPQMIGAELRFDVAHDAALRRRHDAGIVDEDVGGVPRLTKLSAKARTLR